MSIDERAPRWGERMQQPADAATIVHVADDGDAGVVGFIAGGRDRTPESPVDAEIYAVYVRPSFQRTGLGHRLVRALAGDLDERGWRTLLVWVLRDNPCRAFYESLGARHLRDQELDISGRRYVESGYLWDDLRILLEPRGRSL
jgi:GNAT superfamily N-acetyltransferase